MASVWTWEHLARGTGQGRYLTGRPEDNRCHKWDGSRTRLKVEVDGHPRDFARIRLDRRPLLSEKIGWFLK